MQFTTSAKSELVEGGKRKVRRTERRRGWKERALRKVERV